MFAPLGFMPGMTQGAGRRRRPSRRLVWRGRPPQLSITSNMGGWFAGTSEELVAFLKNLDLALSRPGAHQHLHADGHPAVDHARPVSPRRRRGDAALQRRAAVIGRYLGNIASDIPMHHAKAHESLRRSRADAGPPTAAPLELRRPPAAGPPRPAPAVCTPTGSPSTSPSGSVIAAQPVTLATAVQPVAANSTSKKASTRAARGRQRARRLAAACSASGTAARRPTRTRARRGASARAGRRSPTRARRRSARAPRAPCPR